MDSIYQKSRDLVHQVNDVLFGYPDVIIFGENHIDPTHKEEQAKAIRRYTPEYVLLECLDQMNPEEAHKINRIYFRMTLEEITDHFNVNLNEIGVTSNTIPNFNQYLENYATELADHFVKNNIHRPEKARESAMKSVYSGVIPKEIEELIKTPLYEFSSASYQAVERFIFKTMAETDSSHPKFEKIWDLKNYLDQMVPIHRSKLPHQVIRASTLIGSELAGCDINKDDLPRIDSESDSTPEGITNEFVNLANYVNGNRKRREETMATRMIEFANKRKNASPVIVVVGSTHIKRSSFIHPALRAAKIKYRTIKQKSNVPESESYGYALDIIFKE